MIAVNLEKSLIEGAFSENKARRHYAREAIIGICGKVAGLL